MEYKSLEEKFLADYEALERENERLRSQCPEDQLATLRARNEELASLVNDGGLGKFLAKFGLTKIDAKSAGGTISQYLPHEGLQNQHAVNALITWLMVKITEIEE